MENIIEDSFSVRSKLFNIYEEFYFTFNILKQLEKKESTNNSEQLESATKFKLNEYLRQLWSISDQTNFYWHNCSFNVFKSTFQTNYTQYKSKFGKKRFYSLLEKQLSFFDGVSAYFDPELFIPLTKPIMEDLFSLIDYSPYLDDDNFTKILVENNLKFKMIEEEIAKDNYYLVNYGSYFKIKKMLNRESKSDYVEHAQAAPPDGFIIQNMNVFNIDEKAFSEKAIEAITKSLSNISSRVNDPNDTPDRNLNKKNLPKLNIQTRYELFLKLGGQKLIDNILCSTITGTGYVLGTIMDFNPDGSRKLLSGAYRNQITGIQHDKLDEFLKKQDIKIKK